MLSLGVDSLGRPIITQQTTIPSIYLDHWALRYITEDNSLSSRFIKVLKRRGGTLEFSFMNLLEFSEVIDKGQNDQAESFLESICPNLGFINVIPKYVIEREDKLIRGQNKEPPHWDEKLLEFFITRKQKSVNLLSMRGFLSEVRHPKIIEMRRTFMNKFIKPIEVLREKRKNDPKYRYQISAVPHGIQLPRLTRYINQDIANSLIRDDMDLRRPNHWCDFFHTVVPVAYCDFVLIDKVWVHKAQITISRLGKMGQTAAMAQVFSKRDIHKFWEAFDI